MKLALSLDGVHTDLVRMHSVDFQESLTLEDGTAVEGFISTETVRNDDQAYTQTYTMLRSFIDYGVDTTIMRGDVAFIVVEVIEEEGAYKHLLRCV